VNIVAVSLWFYFSFTSTFLRSPSPLIPSSIKSVQREFTATSAFEECIPALDEGLLWAVGLRLVEGTKNFREMFPDYYRTSISVRNGVRKETACKLYCVLNRAFWRQGNRTHNDKVNRYSCLLHVVRKYCLVCGMLKRGTERFAFHEVIVRLFSLLVRWTCKSRRVFCKVLLTVSLFILCLFSMVQRHMM
jgi:hypothetical protein